MEIEYEKTVRISLVMSVEELGTLYGLLSDVEGFRESLSPEEFRVAQDVKAAYEGAKK